MVPFPIPKPSKDYLDALETGKMLHLVCVDLGGHTLTIAVIYGWAGAEK